MKLGIMQPYFFPYLGYFDVINRVDQWIAFDTVRYAPKSWMNRNRILHPQSGWQYVTVPVHKHVGGGTLGEVTVVESDEARRKIIAQLEHYRAGRAPYFTAVVRLVDECFAGTQTRLLRDLNLSSISVVCAYLGIPFSWRNFSDLHLDLPVIEHPGQWALEIADALGADEYLNPPGGRAIFRPAEFRARGITLTFTELMDFAYGVGNYRFIPRLSVLDVLMWAGPVEVKAHLDSLRSGR